MDSHLTLFSSTPPRLEPMKGNPQGYQRAVALTADGRCVFGDKVGLKPSDLPRGCVPYTAEVEKQRRLVCDSALGQLVLDHLRLVAPAVRLVNDGIRKYVGRLHTPSTWKAQPDNAFERRTGPGGGVLTVGQQAVNMDGKYVSNATSFGRLDKITPEQGVSEGRALRGVMNGWLAAFNGDDLAKQMGLHDVFLKVLCTTSNSLMARQQGHTPQTLANALGLREDWYDKEPRGRKANPAFNRDTGGSELPGLIGPGVTIPWQKSLERAGVVEATRRKEKRNRGVDMFQMDLVKILPEYHQELQKHNLGFSAAVSGTTSTLMASAYTFAPVIRSDSEMKKQYLLACVGYLVGSGMHTCHEVFYTGGNAGLPYKTGKYLDMLPRSFVESSAGQTWHDEFWELVRPDRRTTL